MYVFKRHALVYYSVHYFIRYTILFGALFRVHYGANYIIVEQNFYLCFYGTLFAFRMGLLYSHVLLHARTGGTIIYRLGTISCWICYGILLFLYRGLLKGSLAKSPLRVLKVECVT